MTTKPSQFKLTHSRKRRHNFDYPLNAGPANTVIKMAQRHNRTAHIFLTMFTKKSFKKKLFRKNSQQFREWRLAISRELLNFFDSFFTFPHTVLLSLVRKSHERGKQKNKKNNTKRRQRGTARKRKTGYKAVSLFTILYSHHMHVRLCCISGLFPLLAQSFLTMLMI